MLVRVRALVAEDCTLLELVEAVRALPYGRPRERSVSGMLRERRGTCSTNHLFLAEVLTRHFPETEPQVVHRVYTLEREEAARRFGAEVAATIPPEGVTDVNRSLLITVGGRRITLDATFPGPPWDGRSPLALACGAGRDYPAGADPDAEKRALEAEHCDPAAREPFIAALGSVRVAPEDRAGVRT